MLEPIKNIQNKASLVLQIASALGYNIPFSFLFNKQIVTNSETKKPESEESEVADAESEKSEYDKEAFDAQYGKNFESTLFLVPVKLRLEEEPEEEGFQLPLDPLVSIDGKNIIRRRYVAKSKMRGSIKETWSQDDYNITITGLLQNEDPDELNNHIATLRKYVETAQSVHIICDVLNNVFDIQRIAIESYDFPFTKGMENQAFTIKAYSDDNYQLLEENV